MSILDKASFYLPAGAAYKQSEIWAAKPLTDDAKCNFYRDSLATRITDCDEVKTQDNAIPAYRYRDGIPFLQLEQQSTNIIPYYIVGTGWSSSAGCTVTTKYAVSPEGKINASRIQSANSNDYVLESCSVTNGQVYTYSIYAKGESGKQIRLYTDGSGSVNTEFTLDGSWQRFSVNVTATNTGSLNAHVLMGYGSSNPARDFLLWGAQVESGSVPTSLIKTTGSTATRDKTRIRNTNTSLWNNAYGVLYADIYFYGGTSGQTLGIDGGSGVCRIVVDSSGSIQGHYFESSTYKATTDYTVNVGRHKVAYKFLSGSSALFVDGVKVGTSSQTFNTVSFDTLRINELWGAYDYGGVDLYEAAVFDQTLNDDELISLTTL